MSDKENIQYKISAGNLPPNFDWIHTLWLAALTVYVTEVDSLWYWVIGVIALISFVVTIWYIHHIKFIDIFVGFKNDKST